MEYDVRKTKLSYFLYSIAIFALVWGSLWVSTNGVSIARKSGILEIQSANISDINPIIIPDNTYNNQLVSASTSSLLIMFGGDLMLDRGIRLIGEKNGYNSLFASITPLFEKADLAIVNLEGPITSNKSKTVLPNGKTGKELVFTFDPKSARAIASSSIDIVSLANNHTDNFGLRGLNETKKWLDSVGLKWFGDPGNASSTSLVIEKNNIKVAFVGYHAFRKGFTTILNEVKDLSEQGNFVIVMPHWGEEYASSSSAFMRSQARDLVAMGAKAIIGAHPHVVMENVWIGEVPVFYSIGNFIFDQYFSPEVMKGNIVELKLIKTNNLVKIDRVKIYKTSNSYKKGVNIDMEPVDF